MQPHRRQEAQASGRGSLDRCEWSLGIVASLFMHQGYSKQTKPVRRYKACIATITTTTTSTPQANLCYEMLRYQTLHTLQLLHCEPCITLVAPSANSNTTKIGVSSTWAWKLSRRRACYFQISANSYFCQSQLQRADCQREAYFCIPGTCYA